MGSARGTDALWNPAFVRLLVTRLTSQAGDGMFTAGVAFLVLLSPDAQRSPAAYAGVLALLLLPFCLVGPFAATVLDRWRRRQVLVLGQLVRMGLAAVVAVLAVRDDRGPWAYASVLLVLGVNRLLLAALSASVPHVVRRERFLDANALGPTAGTVVTGLGLAVGASVAALSQTGVTVVVAMALWGVSALAARGFGRAELGPDLGVTPPTPMDSVRDLGAVVRHLAHRRRAGAAIAGFGLYRLAFGVWTLAALAAYGSDDATTVLVVGATGVGFGIGALATPVAVRWVPLRRWMTAVAPLSVVGLVGALVGTPWAWAIGGLALGVVGQSAKIATDTTVQRNVDEGFLGRAFTVYDLVYNAPYVAGALLAVPLVS